MAAPTTAAAAATREAADDGQRRTRAELMAQAAYLLVAQADVRRDVLDLIKA